MRYIESVEVHDHLNPLIWTSDGKLKKEVADVVVEKLLDIQTKYNELINGSELDKILDRGREVTNRIAKEKVEEVFSKVGFGRY